MSWDRIKYQEAASCACGKGRVIRTAYQEDDDWNRFRSGSFGEKIECPDCSKKYHLEHLIRHFFQYKWDGDGISDTTYLVENGYSLNHKTKVENLPIYGLEESFVAYRTARTAEAPAQRQSRYPTGRIRRIRPADRFGVTQKIRLIRTCSIHAKTA